MVALYARQKIAAQEQLAHLYVVIATVDSIQGAEYKVVLTTRTDFSGKEAVAFLDETNRVFVAITRAQEGLFDLGDMPSLEQTSNWGKLMEFARRNRCVVTAGRPLRTRTLHL